MGYYTDYTAQFWPEKPRGYVSFWGWEDIWRKSFTPDGKIMVWEIPRKALTKLLDTYCARNESTVRDPK